MKKLFVIMIAVCFTAICMTGCLGDDDSSSNYHNVTSAEKAKIVNAMVGSYSGSIKYASSSSIQDSTTATWTIKSDTTIEFKYPVSLLADYIDTAAVEIYTALKTAPEQTLTLSFNIPSVTYKTVWENYWELGDYLPILYSTETEKKFSNNGCSFTLSYDTYYEIINYGYYNFEYCNSQTQGYIRPKTIIATNSAGVSSTTTINVPTVFYGKK